MRLEATLALRPLSQLPGIPHGLCAERLHESLCSRPIVEQRNVIVLLATQQHVLEEVKVLPPFHAVRNVIYAHLVIDTSGGGVAFLPDPPPVIKRGASLRGIIVAVCSSSARLNVSGEQPLRVHHRGGLVPSIVQMEEGLSAVAK